LCRTSSTLLSYDRLIWAQPVNNRSYDSSVDDVRHKLSYDLEYIRHRSTLEDLRIMLLTPAVMLGRRGAW